MLLKKLDTFVHIKFSNYRRATTTLLVLSVSPPPPLFVFIRLFGSISISSSPYLSTFHCLTLPLSPSVFPTKSIISNRFRTLIECRRHFSTGCKRRVLITENVFLLFCTIEPSSGPLARAKRSVCLCAFMCMFMSHVISQAPSITVKILLTVNADFYLCNWNCTSVQTVLYEISMSYMNGFISFKLTLDSSFLHKVDDNLTNLTEFFPPVPPLQPHKTHSGQHFVVIMDRKLIAFWIHGVPVLCERPVWLKSISGGIFLQYTVWTSGKLWRSKET